MSLIDYLLKIPAIILVTSLHEFTRAAVSTALGDKIPKEEGRLTLNPINHFEPIGMLIMLVSGFGWGKPVNTSSLYYKDRRKGVLITAITPTVVNFVFAVIAMFLAIMFSNIYWLSVLLTQVCYYNCCLVIYNLLPVAPMDCVKVLSIILPANTYFKFIQYEKFIQMAFLFLLFVGFGSLFSGIASGLYHLIALIFI